jgi:hypothetical protein
MSEMHARSVGLAQQRERRQDVFLGARAVDQLQRLWRRADAAGGRHEAGLRLRPLVAAEEEQPVLLQRAAERESCFVATGLRLVDAILLVEEVVGVQSLVLTGVIAGSAEGVRAAARDELEVSTA